ncbi:MAG: hypothetical protein ACFFCQ_12780 [Promethearchaeota archaeon]
MSRRQTAKVTWDLFSDTEKRDFAAIIYRPESLEIFGVGQPSQEALERGLEKAIRPLYSRAEGLKFKSAQFSCADHAVPAFIYLNYTEGDINDKYRVIQEVTTFIISEKRVDQLYLDVVQSKIYEILNWSIRRQVSPKTIELTNEKIMKIHHEVILEENSVARSKLETEVYNLPSFSPAFAFDFKINVTTETDYNQINTEQVSIWGAESKIERYHLATCFPNLLSTTRNIVRVIERLYNLNRLESPLLPQYLLYEYKGKFVMILSYLDLNGKQWKVLGFEEAESGLPHIRIKQKAAGNPPWKTSPSEHSLGLIESEIVATDPKGLFDRISILSKK